MKQPMPIFNLELLGSIGLSTSRVLWVSSWSMREKTLAYYTLKNEYYVSIMVFIAPLDIIMREYRAGPV